jgi:hypothetical protein
MTSDFLIGKSFLYKENDREFTLGDMIFSNLIVGEFMLDFMGHTFKIDEEEDKKNN